MESILRTVSPDRSFVIGVVPRVLQGAEEFPIRHGRKFIIYVWLSRANQNVSSKLWHQNAPIFLLQSTPYRLTPKYRFHRIGVIQKTINNAIFCHNLPLDIQGIAQKIPLTLSPGEKYGLNFI